MNRRQLLQLILASGVAPLATSLSAKTLAGPRPEFVFVPGTWLGGWTWGPVRDRLWREGHPHLHLDGCLTDFFHDYPMNMLVLD